MYCIMSSFRTIQEKVEDLADSGEKLNELKSLTQGLRPRGVTYDKPVSSLESQYKMVSNNIKVDSSTVSSDISCVRAIH